MIRFFLMIYDGLHRRRWLKTGVPLLLFIVLAGLGSRIAMEEDIAGFLPDNPENERLNFVYKNMGIADKIFVRFSLTDTLGDETERLDRLMTGAELFAGKLDTLSPSGAIREIQYRVDVSGFLDVIRFLTENMPYFLEEEDYQRADSLIAAGNFGEVFAANRSLLLSLAGGAVKESILADPFHFFTPVLNRLKNFQLNEYYCLVDDYIFSTDTTHLMMFVTSAYGGSETAGNAVLAKVFEQAAASLPTGVQVDYFGAPLVAVANAERIKADAWQALLLSLLLIVALLGWFFRSLRPLLLVCVPVAFGAAFGLALLYLFKGTVSAIAIGAGSVILGIAVDYSLHYLIHLKHQPDPRMALRDIVNPMLTGNITTVGAFLSLLFISAASMRDLGMFAAFSLVGTILFVLCFLPHWVKGKAGTQKNGWLERFVDFRLEEKRGWVWLVVVLTFFFSFYSDKVAFETDFQQINYMTPAQRQAFAELSAYTTLGEKSIYYVSEGNTLNAALREYEKRTPELDRLVREGNLVGCAGIGHFLLSDSLQKIRIERWERFKSTYGDRLLTLAEAEGQKAGFRAGAFEAFEALWNRDFQVESIEYFQVLRETFLKEYIVQQGERTALVSILYVDPAKAQLIYERLGDQGHSFAFDAQRVAERMVNVLSEDFNLVFYVCGFLVLFFIWFAFGRMELTLIAFLPMTISWIWILGIMGLLDIRFNIVNIILATFIFGLGDDYTIFMVDGLMYEYARGKQMLASYKTSVTLSALTMFMGVGTLIGAAHPAMRSLAEVTVIGMACVVLIAFIVPPLIFRWMVEKKGKLRLRPVTCWNLSVTIYAFLVFLIGSSLLTLYGYVLLRWHRPTSARKLRYHEVLCSVSRWVVRHLPGVRSRLINESGEDFSRPGIIICNHQAHLDLMYVLMLSPKVVVLTNEWVWHCPFYGQIIRFADFYPVADGIERSVERLGELVRQGYSIVVFPEGTRSEDCSIRRFHRGAFYLAEQLHLDLIPVVFHGIGHVLPKTELLLRKGCVTVKILPRITPEEVAFGEGYSERTRLVRKFFQKEYAALAEAEETVRYFMPAVKGSYIYKGREVEQEVRRCLRRKTENERLIAAIPPRAQVLIVGCGVGAFALLCALVRKDVRILAVDEDEDKIAIAAWCRLRPERLQYRKVSYSEIPEMEYNHLIDLRL